MILRFVCILCLSLPPLAKAQLVGIPDPNLRAEIEYQLKKGRDEPITVNEMATVIYVHEWDDDIKDLTGLEFAINLVEVSLTRNAISDISPLAGLTKLQYLYLRSNSISDISPLAGLTGLMDLDLSSNAIVDTSPLAELTNLTQLSLSGNTITDISVLANLTNLEELQLSRNPISDISPLTNLINLTRLELGRIATSNISPLVYLTNLIELGLRGNLVSDVSGLTGLTNLQDLDIGDNSISDLSPLIENIGLGDGDRIAVNDNPLDDISINTYIPALWRRGVKLDYEHLFFNEVGPVRVGDRFTVNLHLEGIPDLVSCRLDISYTPATFTALSVTQGNYPRNDCGQAVFQVGTIDNAAGTITGVNIVFDPSCFLSSNALLSATFEAQAPGEGRVNLHNVAIHTANREGMNFGTLPFETTVKPSYDLNGDGQVNVMDLVVVSYGFGQVNSPADVNADGMVNILDLVAVSQQFTAGN